MSVIRVRFREGVYLLWFSGSIHHGLSSISLRLTQPLYKGAHLGSVKERRILLWRLTFNTRKFNTPVLGLGVRLETNQATADRDSRFKIRYLEFNPIIQPSNY